MANVPVPAGVTSYPLRQGLRYRLAGLVRNATDAAARDAIVLLGFNPDDFIYYSKLPGDWPTDESLPPPSSAEHAFHVEGTWTKDSPMPSAATAGSGAAIVYQAWEYVVDAAPRPGARYSGPKLDDAFWAALRAAAAAIQAEPADLLLMLYGESGLDPTIGNAGGYLGLNQIGSRYLQRLFNVDPDDYLTWSASAQMIRVVGPFLRGTWKQVLGGAVRSPGVLEAINLFPASVKKNGTDPDAVVIDSETDPGAYKANAALDLDHSGAITIKDLDAWLGRRSQEPAFRRALAQLGSNLSPPAPTTPSYVKPLIGSLAIIGLAAAGAWWLRSRK